MTLYRCGNCGLSWPPKPDYRKCPVCQEETVTRAKGAAMSMKEARHLARDADFERFYEAREKARVKAGEESPEEIGAREARDILALEDSFGENTTTVAELGEDV
jgi:hypothetical protein